MKRTWTLAVEVVTFGKTDATDNVIVQAVIEAVGRKESVEPVRPSKKSKQRRMRLEWDWAHGVSASDASDRIRRLRTLHRWQDVISVPTVSEWWRDES